MMRMLSKQTKFALLLLSLLLFSLSLQSVRAAKTDDQTWNLKDVEIRSVIKQVAKITGKNFVVDPRVKGDVTLISHRPLSPDQLYQVFLAVLQVHGYAAVQSGDVVKIIPEKEASQTAPRGSHLSGVDLNDELVVQVVHARYVPSDKIVTSIKPLIPSSSHIAAYLPTNDVIISDRQANVSRIVDIIAKLDRPTHEGTEVIKLNHAAANELVNSIVQLEQTTKRKSTQSVKLAADERTNSILMTGDQQDRLRIRALVSQLDVPNDNNESTQVIYLKFTKASDMAPILANIISSYDLENQQGSQVSSSNSSNPGEAFRRQSRRTTLNTGDSSTSSSSGGLSGSSAASSIQVGGNTEARSGSAGPNVQWEATTNAVIVKAPPHIMRVVKSIINKLDIRRPQVLVEAVIAEVSLDRASELGIEWNTGGDIRLGTRFPSTTGSSISTSLDGILNSTSGTQLSQVGSGLTVGYFSGGNLRALLRALSSDSASNILSTPNIVTLDNETANIKVGELVPFAIGETNNDDQGGNPFTSFDREEVGLSLTIKPQITNSGAIKLFIEHLLSSIVPGSQATNVAGNFTTTERNIVTNVMVDNGQILVLGGLIQNDRIETVQKVPLLGDLPWLGHLFRSTVRSMQKTNLMIFLRPVIMRTYEDGMMITSSKYNYMRQKQLDSKLDIERPVDIEPPSMQSLNGPRRLPPPF